MLYDTILKTIKKKSLIPEGATVIAALSGGADSVCLTDVLYNLQEQLGFKLECAHVNHNLRGEESDGDERFVRQLCERLELTLHIKSVDVKALAGGRSLEDAAREVRYTFFDELTRESGAIIATAHTLNDNVETFFINLLRGSGGRGLCGIPEKRGNIIRPLLEIKREDIISHLDEVGYGYRTDSTNADTAFLRNFIRHNIVPQFESRKDTDIYASVLRATDNLKRDNEALDIMVDKVDTLEIKTLATLTDAVLYRVIARRLEAEFSVTPDSVIFEKIKSLIARPSSKEQLRGQLFARNRGGVLEFVMVEPKNCDCVMLSEGENTFADKVILIKKTKEVYSTLTKASVNCDKIKNVLTARTRRNGDVFVSTKRNCTTRLKKLLINDKVPEEVRDTLTVICDGNDIVFVEGYGADRRYSADKDCQNTICIEIRGDKNGK